MKASLMTVLIVAVVLPLAGRAQVIVDDSWADGGRNNGADALDAAWWSSSSTSGNSVEVGVGFLGLVTGSSGRGLHGTFTPQTLGVGDTLRATFTFSTPATVGTALGGAFRVALADFNNAGLAADLSSASTSVNPLYTSLPAYMADFDVNLADATDDISMREHITPNATGRFTGTTTEWTQLGTGPDANYAFAPNTVYVGVLSVTRTGADSMDIFSSLSQGATLLASHTESDASGIANNFGLLAFWVNASTFGTSATQNTPDNGMDFSNIKIELVQVPEPGTVALIALGALGFLVRRRYSSQN